LNQWPTLERFLDHGEVEIDNNLVENAIRPTAVGKKNWLFFGSEEAGQRSAVIYTLIENCRRHGVDPIPTQRRAGAPTQHDIQEVSQLTRATGRKPVQPKPSWPRDFSLGARPIGQVITHPQPATRGLRFTAYQRTVGRGAGTAGEDPKGGALFVFGNRRHNRIKILYFDGTGVCVLAKRLEEGTFRWPQSAGEPGAKIRLARRPCNCCWTGWI